MVFTTGTVPAGVAAALWFVFSSLLCLTQDRREPPALLTSIPFLSPLFNLLSRRYKMHMYLLHRYNLPLYTLRLPFTRLYIINDPPTVSSLERQTKAISFAAIEAAAMVNLLGLSEGANQTLRRDPTGETGHFVTFHKAFRPALSPGPGLDAMCQRLICGLKESLDRVRQKGPTTVNLFEWIQHEAMLATTDTEFGPGNPFRQPEFERAWYVFERHVPFISAGFLPEIIVKKGVEAREFLAQGFKSYFNQNHHHQASQAFQARLNHSVHSGFTLDDICHGEVGALLASLNNVGPAAFWMLYHIFSDPVVLADCRRELYKNRYVERALHKFSLTDFRNSTPVLMSTFQEMLRYRGVGTLVIRQVLEDHLLDGRYLLKKDGIVLVPHTVQHFRKDIWGPQADAFQHKRFLDVGTGGLKRYNTAAFRPFGSGSTLCLGRHLAQTEILACAALAIANLDMEPVTDSWAQVSVDRSFGVGVARIFLLPDRDIRVRLRPMDDLL